MAAIAGIGDPQRIRLRRRNELKGVCANGDIADRLLDFRHVATHALIARAPSRVMRVRLNGRRVGAVR